jgi:hypothetical protein
VIDSAATPSGSGSAALPDRQALQARTDDIEQAYEYFLGYAAQGLPTESGGGIQIRDYLKKLDAALDGLGVFFAGLVAALKLDAATYRPFIEVIDRDARDSQAAVRLVLAQPSIHSQLIDNLNANIHVRALLTDLFLIDEALKPHAGA